MAFHVPHKNYKSVLVIRANAVSDFRMELAYRHLLRAGFDAEIITQVPFYKAGQFDVFLCCRPGVSMIEFLKVCIIAGKQVIIDLDDDFNSIPRHNPAYAYTGAGHATYLPELKKLLLNPAVVTTFARQELCDRYRVEGIVVPNFYDEENPFWDTPKRKQDGIVTIGWSGTSTHREDFNIVEPTLHKLFAEYPQAHLVVTNDDQLYNRFPDVEEERKLFIPGLPYADYPLVFSYMDIMVAPLRDTHFNRAKSEIKLVECGASKTAYVASDLPFYREWGVGGYVVQDDQWEGTLFTMMENPEMINVMANEGHVKATTERTSKVVCQKWVELVEKLCL